MTMHCRSLVEGRYLQDILDQPMAIEETIDRLELPAQLKGIRKKLEDRSLSRIVLTGMGSSFHALTPAYLSLSAHGYEVVRAETSELLYYLPHLLNDSSLLVIVSQSGRSAETVKLLDAKSAGTKTIAITNSDDNPLAQACDILLLTHAGEEFSVSSKSYVTSLVALEMLSCFLCNGVSDPILAGFGSLGNLTRSYLARWREHVAELSDLLEQTDSIFFVGRGRSLAAAGVGALTTKESVRRHAEAMSSASFRHGPMEMLTERVFVGVFEGEGEGQALNRRLVETIREAKGRTELIGPNAEMSSFRIPCCPSGFSPVLEILPLQMVTLALGNLLGIEAGKFALASKVTATE